MIDFDSFKVIVFDKDGTLGNDTASLFRWIHHMTQKVEQDLLQNATTSNGEMPTTSPISTLVEEFHSAMGFRLPNENGQIKNSLLPSAPVASATWEEILDICQQIFKRSGIKDAREKTMQWHDEVKNLHGQDPPLVGDLRGLLQGLKQTHGFLIAICTSDDRSSTDASLKNWNLTDVVNVRIRIRLLD